MDIITAQDQRESRIYLQGLREGVRIARALWHKPTNRTTEETETMDPAKIASFLRFHADEIDKAIASDMRNESTAVELALMSIGDEAEEQGIARFLSNGINNAIDRRIAANSPNTQRPEVRR